MLSGLAPSSGSGASRLFSSNPGAGAGVSGTPGNPNGLVGPGGIGPGTPGLTGPSGSYDGGGVGHGEVPSRSHSANMMFGPGGGSVGAGVDVPAQRLDRRSASEKGLGGWAGSGDGSQGGRSVEVGVVKGEMSRGSSAEDDAMRKRPRGSWG